MTAPRSILSEHIALGAVRPEHLSVGAATALTIPSFSTTNVGDWFQLTATGFYIPTSRCHLYVPITLHVWHSDAANGAFDIQGALYYVDTAGNLTGGQTFWQMLAVSVARTSNNYLAFLPVMSASFDTDHLDRVAAMHWLIVFIKNRATGQLLTAGTDRTNTLFAYLVGKGRPQG